LFYRGVSLVDEILAKIQVKPTIYSVSVKIAELFLLYRYFMKDSYFTTLMDAMKTNQAG